LAGISGSSRLLLSTAADDGVAAAAVAAVAVGPAVLALAAV
jgi:hypothetical protein